MIPERKQLTIISRLRKQQNNIIDELVDLMSLRLKELGRIESCKFNEHITGYDFSCSKCSYNLYLYYNNINEEHYVKYKESKFVIKININLEKFNQITFLLQHQTEIPGYSTDDVFESNGTEIIGYYTADDVFGPYDDLEDEDHPF